MIFPFVIGKGKSLTFLRMNGFWWCGGGQTHNLLCLDRFWEKMMTLVIMAIIGNVQLLVKSAGGGREEGRMLDNPLL